jgi:hypothetical protein
MIRSRKTNSWYWRSRDVITVALDSGRKMGLKGKELIDHVSALYPFSDRSGFAYQQWLLARKELMGGLLREGGSMNRVPASAEILDRDYFARLDGPGSPAWETMLCRKRGELAAAGIEADDWDDRAVADWRPGAKEGAGDG